ncbi:FUSC family protein [Streptomyces physcomitrii]|uniref:FUSC family protein n=1 Tax=Streptomyces physcomitrii TaxID=2724184 RepID=A0ABX1GXY1_9ACTN|nr:FUSC family protein [Streptomyces physcomitrii]NKI40959.1 FUSC family protein [Streptomyces physcomitrii]
MPPFSSRSSRRPLPLLGVLRPVRGSEIWFKSALSAVSACALPNLLLIGCGRPDLVMYAMGGSLCALYGHHLPYAARARVVTGVVLGMTAGTAVALTTASLTRSAWVLVAVAAVLAAVQRAGCEAARVGPPGHLILTFVSSASLFAPQSLGQVPGHLALTASTGALALAVVMAPALPRPLGPERRSTRAALRAVAAALDPGAPAAAAHAGAAAALHTAWQYVSPGGGRGHPDRRALALLVLRAETALALGTARTLSVRGATEVEAVRSATEADATQGAAEADPTRGAAEADARPAEPDAAQLLFWADQLRRQGPVPQVAHSPAELLALEAHAVAPAARARAPHAAVPLAPVLRTLVGGALAGWAAVALGAGRPYWALVTVAALLQANGALTWRRGVQRVVGSLAGLGLFGALAPLARFGPLALVLCTLVLVFGAEALITRNYWLGTLCVTPMALLVTEFPGLAPSGELAADRLLDTLVGAALGLLATALVTNRWATGTFESALDSTERACEAAERALGVPAPDPAGLHRARRRLAAELVALRAAADTAAGEWRQRALPGDRLLRTERRGHRTLAAVIRKQDRHGQPHRHPSLERCRAHGAGGQSAKDALV